jgi:hypothetical protein
MNLTGEVDDGIDDSVAELQRQNLKARTAKETAFAHRARLEAAALAGDLLYRDDVVDLWSDTITRSRAKILSLPSRLAATLSSALAVPPAQVEKIASDVISEALKELSEYDHNDYANAARRRRKRVADAETANEGTKTGGGGSKAGNGTVGATSHLYSKSMGGKDAATQCRKQRGGGKLV